MSTTNPNESVPYSAEERAGLARTRAEELRRRRADLEHGVSVDSQAVCAGP
ncbi:unnamed protein product [Mycolicibacterium novocastrense]|uniref:DUF899 domain-containing protein n=1 Tax=Mycolicibacterium novocastrense TaxID=59813 RepID=A0ABQ0KT45_MYCNV|nr:unnamed protein product [Mycolicibacterium novocastrense]